MIGKADKESESVLSLLDRVFARAFSLSCVGGAVVGPLRPLLFSALSLSRSLSRSLSLNKQLGLLSCVVVAAVSHQ